MQKTPKQPPSALALFHAKFKRFPIPAAGQTGDRYEALMRQSLQDGKIHPDVMLMGEGNDRVS